MENKQNYILYMHIFPNNKKYIGITKRKVEERWINGNGYKKQKIVYNAIKKYGWENIKHIIILNNLSFKNACKKEIEYIQKYNTTNIEFGYNNSIGGEKSALGFKHSEEEKQKIKEHNAKYWKNKHRGSQFMSEIAKGNKNRKGKKHSENSKQLNREKHSIKVIQFDLQGNFIKEWNSIKEAENSYKLPRGSISKVCKNKRKTTGGYKWEYK